MIISKHLHSCLLVKDAGKVFLIDPGNYTYEAKALNLDSINQLDYLLITHDHQDHIYLPFIKEVLAKFPNLKIISNQAVVDFLAKDNINVSTTGDNLIVLEKAPHEPIFFGTVPENTVFKINNKLTHPGDTHHLQSTTEVLALPIQAPWGSTTNAVNLALKLKPKIIIPIHDWHWNDRAREGMYLRLVDFFVKNNIKFIPIENGEEVEV